MASTANLSAVAHHEAGHLVVGRALGREVERATIREDVADGMRRCGHVTFAPLPSLASLHRARIAAQKERWIEAIAISSAGRIAQPGAAPDQRSGPVRRPFSRSGYGRNAVRASAEG
jgi:hypothetical protein